MTIAAHDPLGLLQTLIRFDSVNPPGNEKECVDFVAKLLIDAGLDTRLVGAHSARPNLVARLPGRGVAPPVLLHAHADVVPVDPAEWTHPPFEGRIVDGHVWGRGAIDMKGSLAMMICALLRLRAEGIEPAGDVILALSPDEEAGSTVGARYLVKEHPELVSDARYAVGEDGGAVMSCASHRLHPIVVAEKRACWQRVTLRGPGGHASRQGRPDNAVAKLARLLTALCLSRLPMHLTPAAKRMLDALAGVVAPEIGARLAGLCSGTDTQVPYDLLPEADAIYLDSVLRHTVNATIVRTTEKINMIPSQVSVDLDGRILPGAHTVEDYTAELLRLIGEDLELELLLEGSPMPDPTFGPFYDLLCAITREADPDGVPIPMLTPASTDARLFAGLGIACYGWVPMLLPAGSRYQDTMHAANERVPVEAVRFGADCLHRMLLRYR